MPSRKKHRIEADISLDLKIQLPSSLYHSIVPIHASIILRWCVGLEGRGFTSVMCERATGFLWRDCAMTLHKLNTLGMLTKHYEPTTCTDLAIYTVRPFVILESSGTRKRKRHIAKVCSLNHLNTWLKTASDISIYRG